MSHSRIVFAAAVALCAVVPATAAAYVPAPAAIELSTAGQRALKQSSLTLATVPRTTKPKTLWLAPGKTTIGSSAAVELTGTLRFTAGKRKLDATALKLTVGRTSSSISGRLGGKTLKLLTVTPTRPAELDAAAGRVALTRARLALTRPAAQTLRSKLKLKRTPSTTSLGTLTVTVAPPPAVPLSPAPQPIAVPAPATTPDPTPVATATPTATPDPEPGPTTTCEQRLASTPSGSLDWFACDLPGAGDLKRWTDYIYTPFPPVPCLGAQGSVVTAGGAARIDPGAPWDHRFTIASSDLRLDGSATIRATGSVTYRMPVHGIEETIGAFRLEIAPGGQTGVVYADGAAKLRDMGPGGCTVAPTPYAAQPVLTLDLSGIVPVTANGVRRWTHVPAKVAPGYETLVAGGTYAAGAAWGSFTVAVPVA